jgi:hypothetical protein
MNSKIALALQGLLMGVVALVLHAAFSASAAETSKTDTNKDYSAFKIITDRNIFNSRRYARSGPAPKQETTQRTPVDSFTLLGTMSYEKGLFAFFDGTRSDFRKAAKPGDTVGGYKVDSIEQSKVKLVSGTNALDLPVGMQLRKDDEGSWKLAAAERSFDSSPNPPRAPTNPVTTRTEASPATNPEAPPDFGPGGPPMVALPGAEGFQPPPGFEGGAPTNAASVTAPAGNDPNSVLERLRQRAAAERGE